MQYELMQDEFVYVECCVAVVQDEVGVLLRREVDMAVRVRSRQRRGLLAVVVRLGGCGCGLQR